MHWVNLILGCLRMDDNDDEGWVVTKNWDSPAATVGGYWRSWPRGGAGNKQKFLSIWFENSPNLPFSREAQRNSRRMMDEELSGRKIWVICQVWSESSSRHVSTAVEKLGSWADSSFFQMYSEIRLHCLQLLPYIVSTHVLLSVLLNRSSALSFMMTFKCKRFRKQYYITIFKWK